MVKFLTKTVAAAAVCSLFCFTPAFAEVNKAEVSHPELTSPITYSLAWHQSAAEYKALCLQTYHQAEKVMQEKVAAGNYVKENGKLYEPVVTRDAQGRLTRVLKPVAIVLDLDETVFDNMPFEVWGIMNNESYNEDNWNAWCMFQGSAKRAHQSVPGSVNFLLKCQKMGITPIYLTDRNESTREGTLSTLRGLGLGTPDLNERLILRDKVRDRETGVKLLKELNLSQDSEYGRNMLANASSKDTRRQAVLTKYQVIGWFGDNMYDFPLYVPAAEKDPAVVRQLRNEQVEEVYGDSWGNSMFMIPNAVYGSWIDGQALPRGQVRTVLDDAGFGEWQKTRRSAVKAPKSDKFR